MSVNLSDLKMAAIGAGLTFAMAPGLVAAQSDADSAFVAELAPAETQDRDAAAPEDKSASRKIVIREADGSSREIEIGNGAMVFIDEDGTVRMPGEGMRHFSFMTARRDGDRDDEDIDIDVDIESDGLVERDGDRIVIDMEHLRRRVDRARDRASSMQGRAMLHFDRAMDRMQNFAFEMDSDWLDRSKLDRLVDRIERTEARMRAGIEREWRGGLATMLDRLAREIEEIEREGGEVAEEAVEARRQALAEARVELGKAEDIRRRALEQAADELREARLQLEERREALRKSQETQEQE